MGEKELIYRADVRRALLRNYPEAAHCVERVRTVSVEVEAEWINERIIRGGFHEDWGYDCSNCKTMSEHRSKFCPECGAKMKNGRGKNEW